MNEFDENKKPIPFTARLMAYYRAQESKKECPLFVDPFAERLAGDLTSYFKKDESFLINDYPLIRTHYIDERLLKTWCQTHSNSQIVILGAGLDTRAYRFEPLQSGNHSVYEIDFPIINQYKQNILKNEDTFCRLERISADITNSDWRTLLLKRGFSKKNPVFWILEGVAYYIQKEEFKDIYDRIINFSDTDNQFFVDICDPVCAEVDFGPYFGYFKWGLFKEEVEPFFFYNGWKISYCDAEDFDQGRFVGAGLMIFIHGKRIIKNDE